MKRYKFKKQGVQYINVDGFRNHDSATQGLCKIMKITGAALTAYDIRRLDYNSLLCKYMMVEGNQI